MPAGVRLDPETGPSGGPLGPPDYSGWQDASTKARADRLIANFYFQDEVHEARLRANDAFVEELHRTVRSLVCDPPPGTPDFGQLVLAVGDSFPRQPLTRRTPNPPRVHYAIPLGPDLRPLARGVLAIVERDRSEALRPPRILTATGCVCVCKVGRVTQLKHVHDSLRRGLGLCLELAAPTVTPSSILRDAMKSFRRWVLCESPPPPPPTF